LKIKIQRILHPAIGICQIIGFLQKAPASKLATDGMKLLHLPVVTG
jgi:hypothetical protein